MRDLARVLGRLELRQQLAQLGPLRDLQLDRELVAAHERPRRALAAPVERRRQHFPGEGEMGLDRLLAGERARAARREPVGDRQQGHVDADRLRRPQVLVDPARRQRRLVDQEAEAQVVQGQVLEVAGEGAARAQPGAERADDLGAVAVVAEEGDVAVPLGPRRRLADVVQERAEAQRGGAAHLVGERLGEQRPAPPARSPPKRSSSASTSSVCSSTAIVWPWTSRWWLGPCSTPRRASSSGSTTAVRPSSSSSAQPAQRIGAADQLAQLDQLPLAGRLAGARGFGASEGDGGGIDLQLQAGGEPGRPQETQRIGGEAALAHDPQDAAVEVGEAAVGIDRLAAGERHGDRADGEVALRQIGLDRLAAQRRQVDLP